MPARPLPVIMLPRPRSNKKAASALRRVFICDDDQAFATELAEVLSAQNFLVGVRARERDVIRQIAEFRPDVILLDIYMPPPDGFEIINHLHNAEYRNDMTLVLMSGASTDLLGVATRLCLAHRLKVGGAFQKPLSLTELMRACRVPAGSRS